MRILYVVHQFYPQFHSGTEQFVLALARAGRRSGDDVRVFTVDPDFRQIDPPRELRHYEVQGVPVTCYRFDREAIRNYVLAEYYNPDVGVPFREQLDDFRPEAVHFFHLRWLGADRFADVEARGIPTFIHLMDFWFACPNFLLLRLDGALCDGPPDEGLGCFDCVNLDLGQSAREPGARENYETLRRAAAQPPNQEGGESAGYAMIRRPVVLADVLRRADRVLAPSHTVRDVLAAAGARSERVQILPYGVDWDLLEDIPSPPPVPITLGFMGTFAPHKGVHLLVQAFRGLTGDVRLRLHGRFGDYPDYDKRLRQIAGDDVRIEFAGSFERHQLGEVLGGLHAVVVPSVWRENTPFVCLEARAAGIPVIASNLEGMAEAVPTERGRLFENGDATDLRRVLQELCDEIDAGSISRQPDRSISSIPDQYAVLRDLYARGGAGRAAGRPRT